MADQALPERRNDVDLAIVKTQLQAHLESCDLAHKTVDSRLSRIEKGIIGAWGTMTVGGIITIAFLIRIVLHLG